MAVTARQRALRFGGFRVTRPGTSGDPRWGADAAADNLALAYEGSSQCPYRRRLRDRHQTRRARASPEWLRAQMGARGHSRGSALCPAAPEVADRDLGFERAAAQNAASALGDQRADARPARHRPL